VEVANVGWRFSGHLHVSRNFYELRFPAVGLALHRAFIRRDIGDGIQLPENAAHLTEKKFDCNDQVEPEQDFNIRAGRVSSRREL
jgi:hypothetical protein